MIFLGKIVKTRGNKGEVVVTPSPHFETCSPGQGEAVFLRSAKYQIQEEIEYTRNIRGIWVFKFAGIDSINHAYKLVGYAVYTTQAAAPSSGAADGEAAGTIAGAEFIVKDVNGCVWGKVKQIETYGLFDSNQILEVEGDQGDVIYIPFTQNIVKQIDEEKKTITIDPPNGLKELNKE